MPSEIPIPPLPGPSMREVEEMRALVFAMNAAVRRQCGLQSEPQPDHPPATETALTVEISEDIEQAMLEDWRGDRRHDDPLLATRVVTRNGQRVRLKARADILSSHGFVFSSENDGGRLGLVMGVVKGGSEEYEREQEEVRRAMEEPCPYCRLVKNKHGARYVKCNGLIRRER